MQRCGAQVSALTETFAWSVGSTTDDQVSDALVEDLRHRTRDFLLANGASTDLAQRTLLVANELAINAAHHAGGILAFEVSLEYDGVRVSVTDPGDGPFDVEPALRYPDFDAGADALAEGGRGLLIVRSLAASVDVVSNANGKTISVVVPPQ
jgi:anti-sigma regulatory factor (Ser/Thr protein kinase)